MNRYAIQSHERWRTDQPDAPQSDTTDLSPGQIIIWGKAPFRVVSAETLNPGNWPDEYAEAWREGGEPDPATWASRPIWLAVQRDTDPGDPERGGIVPADGQWVVLPEHYSVCRHCGELPPCPEVFADRVMEIESRRIEFEMTIAIGSCHACGRRVTPRDSVLFPGDNLVRPDLGVNTAVFHTRRGCLPIALAYQDRWMAADSARTTRIQPVDGGWRLARISPERAA